MPCFINLYENYIGSYSKFRNRSDTDIRQISNDNLSTASVKTTILAFFNKNQFELPEGLYTDKKSIVSKNNSVELFFQGSSCGQDMNIQISPIRLNRGERRIVIKGIIITLQRLANDETGTDYLSSWTVRGESITGSCDALFVNSLDDFVSCFHYHFQDYARISGMNQNSIQHELMVFMLSISFEAIELSYCVDNIVCRILGERGLYYHSNNYLVETGYFSKIFVVPSIVLSWLFTNEAKSANEIIGAEVLRFEGALICKISESYPNLNEMKEEQRQFLQDHDRLSKRLVKFMNSEKPPTGAIPENQFKYPLYFHQDFISNYLASGKAKQRSPIIDTNFIPKTHPSLGNLVHYLNIFSFDPKNIHKSCKPVRIADENHVLRLDKKPKRKYSTKKTSPQRHEGVNIDIELPDHFRLLFTPHGFQVLNKTLSALEDVSHVHLGKFKFLGKGLGSIPVVQCTSI